MQVALYAHPFDLNELDGHGGLSRLRDLGVSELSLATTYHDGRWLTPWHPSRRVRFLEDGIAHFRPRNVYTKLQPVISSEVPDEGLSPLEELCVAGPAKGLRVRAWAVLGHNTRLGLKEPSLTVANAFGDRYPYALCPAQSAVQDYHETIIRDLAGHDGLGSIELEALGQMGFQHSSHHDKRSIEPKGLLAFALSACFCPACLAAFTALGVDGELVRREVRAFLTEHTTDADAMAPESLPSGDDDLDAGQRQWVENILAVRADSISQMEARVRSASGSCARAVQVHPDPWFTGSQLSIRSAKAFAKGDERVLTCYGMGPEAIAKLWQHDAMRSMRSGPQRLSIWPKAPQFCYDEDLQEIRRICTEHGVETIAIYHLGLLPWRTIERAVKMLSS